MNEKPVMYLDIDDTLIVDDPPLDRPANNTKEFLEFAKKHFEVRWLSFRCPEGKLEESVEKEIATILQIPRELIADISNPLRFLFEPYNSGSIWYGASKTVGVDWDEYKNGRQFVWVEDDLMAWEKQILRGYGCKDAWIPCNVSKNPNRLNEVMEILKERFEL